MNVWESPGKLCLHLLGFVLSVSCRKWLEGENPSPERQKAFSSCFPLRCPLPLLLPGTKQENSAGCRDATGPSASSPPLPGREDCACSVGCTSAPRNGAAETINTRAIKHPQQYCSTGQSAWIQSWVLFMGPAWTFISFLILTDWRMRYSEMAQPRAQEWSSQAF